MTCTNESDMIYRHHICWVFSELTLNSQKFTCAFLSLWLKKLIITLFRWTKIIPQTLQLNMISKKYTALGKNLISLWHAIFWFGKYFPCCVVKWIYSITKLSWVWNINEQCMGVTLQLLITGFLNLWKLQEHVLSIQVIRQIRVKK